MPKINIPETLIATSDPAMISEGFHFYPDFHFPDWWSVDVSETILDPKPYHSKLTGVNIEARVSIGGEAGLSGPNYGTSMIMNGELDSDTGGSKITLAVKEDNFVAGTLNGIKVYLSLYLYWKQYVSPWYTKELINIDKNISYDLITIFANVARKIGKKIPGLDTILAFIPKGAEKGFWDMRSGITGINKDIKGDELPRGSIQLTPTMEGFVDLVNLAETLAEDGEVALLEPEGAAIDEETKSVVEAEEDAGVKVQTGPVLGIVLPITISISKLKAYDVSGYEVTFDQLNFSDGGVNGTSDNSLSNLDKIGVCLTHRVGFDIRFGWKVKASFAKKKSWQSKWETNLLADFGVDISQLNPEHTNEIKNQAGSETTGSIEVVFLGSSQ